MIAEELNVQWIAIGPDMILSLTKEISLCLSNKMQFQLDLDWQSSTCAVTQARTPLTPWVLFMLMPGHIVYGLGKSTHKYHFNSILAAEGATFLHWHSD